MRNCLARGFALALALGLALGGCGDNSRSCGPATREEDGYCVPSGTCGFGTRADEETGACVPDGTVVCSAGTRFDPLTGQCGVDPGACQNGTVLIDGRCVDPTVSLIADLQEGPEPNGLGILEASAAQAGNVTPKPIGDPPFILHGTIDPHVDSDGVGGLDPDVDTYVVTIAAPTLLQITADGVHGITAGFVFVAAVDAGDPLVGWRRFGINLDGDHSSRQVFLPKAGTYRVAIADTRTLFEYVLTGAAASAPGGDDGDYYISVANVALPAPTPVPISGGTGTAAGTIVGDTVAFYGAPLGAGSSTVELAMPSAFSVASLVISATTLATADESSAPAQVTISGPAGPAVIAVDHVYNVSPTPIDFTLDVTTP